MCSRAPGATIHVWIGAAVTNNLFIATAIVIGVPEHSLKLPGPVPPSTPTARQPQEAEHCVLGNVPGSNPTQTRMHVPLCLRVGRAHPRPSKYYQTPKRIHNFIS